MKTNKKWGSGGFKVLAVLAVTQVFCKRVITPLFATPLAAWLKGLVDKKGKTKGNEQAPVNNDTKAQNNVSQKENVQFAGYNVFNPSNTFKSFERMIQQ